MDYLTEHADEIQSFMTKPGSGCYYAEQNILWFYFEKKELVMKLLVCSLNIILNGTLTRNIFPKHF